MNGNQQTAAPAAPVVGFIGLGRMGRHIAGNLLAAGNRVVVHDISPAARQALAERGGEAVATIAELTGRADVIFTCLPTPAIFDEVVSGPEGIVPNLRAEGVVVIDMSTNARSTILKVHAALAARRCHLLDAPMSGGTAGAENRELVVWAGGERSVYDAVLPLIRQVANYPMYVGAIGNGTTTKLAHNMTSFMFQRALAESFSLAVKAGLAPLDFWKALRYGMAGRQSPIHMLPDQFLVNDYEDAGFALALAHKDLGLALAMAEDLGVPVRQARGTYEDMDAAVAEGLGGKESRVFLRQQLARAGVEIEADRAQVAEMVAQARRS